MAPSLRIATWNCCSATAGKTAEAVAALGASVCVLQEAQRPAALPAGHLWLGPNPRKGLAVVPGAGFTVALGPIAPAAPWSIVPVRGAGPARLNLLLVWTRQEHRYIEGLDPALSAYARFLAEAPSVVIGDLNGNVIWDNPRRPTDFSRVARRMSEQFGLVSAYHAFTGESFGSESRATLYLLRRRSRPYHIDYCFIPRTWRRRLRGVEILDRPPWDAMSDHRPVVVDLARGAALRTSGAGSRRAAAGRARCEGPPTPERRPRRTR